MKSGIRRLFKGLHKTGRNRAGRYTELGPVTELKEIPGWRKCTTIKPMEVDDGQAIEQVREEYSGA